MRLKAPPLLLKWKQAEAANDIDVNATELLATRVLYRLWVGILAPVFAFSALIAITKASAFWIPTVGMGAVTATIIAWLQTTRLALVNGEVRYRSLLVSTRLSASEIAGAEFLMGFSSFKPFQRIVFRMRGSNKEITLNAGLFEPKLVKRWVEELSRQSWVKGKYQSGLAEPAYDGCHTMQCVVWRALDPKLEKFDEREGLSR